MVWRGLIALPGPRSKAVTALKRLGMRVVLTIFSLGVALLSAEVIVRVACPQQLAVLRPDIWEPVEILGWRKQPHLNTTVNNGEGAVGLYTDSRGFRIGSGPRPAGGKRILLLGDSFVEALAVEYEESMAGQIEARFSKQAVGPVEVWSTGVSHWGPCQYLILMKSLLPDHKFDLVLVALFAGNDAVEEWQRSFAVRESTAARWMSPLHRVDWFLKCRSHVFTLIKSGVELLLVRLDLRKTDLAPMCLKSEATSRRWDVTADICAEIRNTAALHGVETLFFLIPSDLQVNRDMFLAQVRRAGLDSGDWDLDQPDDLLRAALETRGLDTIDLLPTLRAGFAADNELYGRVDNHLNARGHAVVANALEPAIKEALTESRYNRAGNE